MLYLNPPLEFLPTLDPDTENTHLYLVAWAGDADNDDFKISGNCIKKIRFYDVNGGDTAYTIRQKKKLEMVKGIDLWKYLQITITKCQWCTH